MTRFANAYLGMNWELNTPYPRTSGNLDLSSSLKDVEQERVVTPDDQEMFRGTRMRMKEDKLLEAMKGERQIQLGDIGMTSYRS
ncbi:MAG: hypothetical protein QGH47_02655 [Candidatus Woesearchaeota archaeon]|mgnify:CR=1 FL=1|jgi:hypothetical protein|nr:hypothetical protein [Candidatus Woesearchaeota archaeon]